MLVSEERWDSEDVDWFRTMNKLQKLGHESYVRVTLLGLANSKILRQSQQCSTFLGVPFWQVVVLSQYKTVEMRLRIPNQVGERDVKYSDHRLTDFQNIGQGLAAKVAWLFDSVLLSSIGLISSRRCEFS
jgi:hypothetical protein